MPSVDDYNIYRSDRPGGEGAVPYGTVAARPNDFTRLGLKVLTDTAAAEGTTDYYQVSEVFTGHGYLPSAGMAESDTPHPRRV